MMNGSPQAWNLAGGRQVLVSESGPLIQVFFWEYAKFLGGDQMIKEFLPRSSEQQHRHFP